MERTIFPFRDALYAIAADGTTAVVQPGGPKRDAEVMRSPTSTAWRSSSPAGGTSGIEVGRIVPDRRSTSLSVECLHVRDRKFRRSKLVLPFRVLLSHPCVRYRLAHGCADHRLVAGTDLHHRSWDYDRDPATDKLLLTTPCPTGNENDGIVHGGRLDQLLAAQLDRGWSATSARPTVVSRPGTAGPTPFLLASCSVPLVLRRDANVT